MDDQFEKSFGLTLEQIAELAPLQKKRRSRTRPTQRIEFVKLPYAQTLMAAGQIGSPRLAVLIEIAYRRFKRHQNPVPLASKALEAVGITRWAKNRALVDLERAGLIAVTWRRGASPLVTDLVGLGWSVDSE